MSCNLIQVVANAAAAIVAKTVLLLHLNGNTADDTGKVMTTVGTIGWSSGRSSPDGTQELIVTGINCGLQAPNHNDFIFGTNDFTIECWFVNTNANTVGPRALVSAGGVTIGYDPSKQASWVSAAGTNLRTANSTTSPVGVRTHLAYSRVNGVGYLFSNGTLVLTFADNYNYSNNTCTVALSAGGATYWYGFMDEVRVTNGKGRYTSNFTPALTTFTTDV